MTGILQILFAAYAGKETISADFLVIAGGGGGGKQLAGGGGAGGYREFTGQSLDVGTAYTVTVGAGGAGGAGSANQPGVVGNNSVFSTITSAGGGLGCSNKVPGGPCQACLGIH